MPINVSPTPTGLTVPTPSGTGIAASQAPTAQQAAASTGSTALGQLASNYTTFLKLLMTQLQNQDPSSPMDTNQFTTELVQFSSVEQQINTNASLTQLIQLTQSGSLLQSSSLVGHSVSIVNSDMPVQSGTGQIQFTAPTPGQVSVSVFDSTGKHLTDSLVQAAKGVNDWTWNATDGNGTTQSDGAYKVVVKMTDMTGTTTTLPYNAIGVATGVTKKGTTLQIQLGKITTDFSSVQSVLN